MFYTQDDHNHNRRVGWICTYTPEEVILAAGFTPYRILPSPGERNPDDLLPSNICPYVRQVARAVRDGSCNNLEGVVVAHSCNAMMHLYSVLQEEVDGFVYLLDLPRHRGEDAATYFAHELTMLADFLSERGEFINEERLREATKIYGEREGYFSNLLYHDSQALSRYGFSGWYGLAVEAATSPPVYFNGELARIVEDNRFKQAPSREYQEVPALLLTGGIPPRSMMEVLLKSLKEFSSYQLLPENCAGMRYLQREPASFEDGCTATREKMLQEIARSYLKKPPCPRIFHYQHRERYFRRLLEQYHIQGVVYHDLMFCDMSHYDYLLVKEILDEKEIPVLQVKTELGAEEVGPLKTRIEAFLELMEVG